VGAPCPTNTAKTLSPLAAMNRIVPTLMPARRSTCSWKVMVYRPRWVASYGAIWSPKWFRGLTMSADFWHIDLRSIVASLGAQFIIDKRPELVIRDPTTGAIKRVIDPNFNVTDAVLEGVDYEAIYILDSAIFGHGDFGRLTFTLNGTWLSRFVLQVTPDLKPINIAGQFVSTSFTFTGSLPRNRAYFSLFWDGPADTWLGGFDLGATVHWTGQYSDDFLDGVTRKCGSGLLST
jgi:hypothetical protein